MRRLLDGHEPSLQQTRSEVSVTAQNMQCVLSLTPQPPPTAAAKRLKGAEGQLRGTVRLLFQPAEEGMGGAKVMIEEGALDGVSAVFGLHVLPFTPTGVVELRVGGWLGHAVGTLARCCLGVRQAA